MPTVCTVFVANVKYVDNTLRLRATDYTIAYWGIMSLAFEIVGLVSYKHEFSTNLWTIGFFGSLLNLLGCMFAIAAMTTGSPAGPTSALISGQTILVTVLEAIINMKAPSWL